MTEQQQLPQIPISNYCEITELSEGYNFIYPITIKVVNLREDQIFIAEYSTFNLYSQAKTYEGSLDRIKTGLTQGTFSKKGT